MGRDIFDDTVMSVPSNVTVKIKARYVIVTGPRGRLEKNLRHINLDIQPLGHDKIKFIVWHGARKHVACLRTVRSLIENMITGVTKGFQYKMRLVSAHFPINCIINDEATEVEIRNFLGEKAVRNVKLLPGCTIKLSEAIKDELIVEGNNLENVSQSCASIKNICNVRNKDIRKFLDGIYVSEKGTIVKEE